MGQNHRSLEREQGSGAAGAWRSWPRYGLAAIGCLTLFGACALEDGGESEPAPAAVGAAAVTAVDDDGDGFHGSELRAAGTGNSLHMRTASFVDRPQLQQVLNSFTNSNTDIDAMASDPDGDWIVVAGNQVEHSSGISSFLVGKVEEYIDRGRDIDVIAFAPNGSWTLIAEDLHWRSGGVPKSSLLGEKIVARQQAGARITDLAFTANGWSLVSGGWAYSTGVGSKLYNAVYERRPGHRGVQVVETAPSDGRFVVVADQWTATDDIGANLQGSLTLFQRTERRIDHLMLGPDGSYVLYSNGGYEPDAADPMGAIEYGLQGGASNIWQRMVDTGVNGISVAVVDGNEVTYARGYGVLRAGEQDFVRASSPFDTASLSKMVGAMVTMTLADDGIVDLDEPVNDIADTAGAFNTLAWWRAGMQSSPTSYDVDDVDLSDRVTVRRLLSHTAGLVPHSSTGILDSRWPGTDPSTLQLLLGFHCDAPGDCNYGDGRGVWHDTAIATATAPDGGAAYVYDYSGGGFLLADAVAEVESGQDFETLAEQRLLSPLGLDDATFRQPLPASFASRAAWHHNGAGVARGERAHYPWHSAGGLYSSPRDYAEIMIVLMNQGVGSNGVRILETDAVEEMLRDHAPGGARYGFGVGLTTNQVSETSGRFGHSGSHGGRARTRMTGIPERDQGIVIMVNGEGGDVSQLIGEIESAYRCAYGWDDC